MRDTVSPLRIMRAATLIAWGDLAAVYSPLSWGVGWMGRVLAQVLFFGIIGLLLDDPDAVVRLAIGQAVFMAWMESTLAVQSTTWERTAGTFPLLIAAPGSLWPVLVGRSVQWIGSGVATSCIALFALCPMLGVTWTLPSALTAAVGVLAASLGGYAVGLTLGAWVLSARAWRNIVPNLMNGVLVSIAGVTVPTTFWPFPLQVIAQAFPITHALAFVRGAQAGTPDVIQLIAAFALTALWLALACGSMAWFVHRGRRDGTITFGE